MLLITYSGEVSQLFLCLQVYIPINIYEFHDYFIYHEGETDKCN